MRSAFFIVLSILTAGADRIDLAEFGRVVQYSGDAPETLRVKPVERGLDGWETWTGPDGQAMIGLEFDEPRDLAEVGIEFRHAIAHRDLIRVQYFQHTWPNSRQDGWAPQDDPFHGKWVTAKAECWAGDRDVHFGFLPYNQERSDPAAPDCTYRRTYRVRFLLGDRELPAVRYIRAYGPRPADEGEFNIRFDRGSTVRLPLDVSVVNGILLEGKSREPSTEMPLDFEPATMNIRYARGDLETPTRTVVTLRNANDAQHGMSFLPAEAAKFGSIRIPALGVTIVYQGPPESQPAAQVGASIYDRVAAEPQQTFDRARREIPELDARGHGRYVPLGPPDARQEIAVRFDGGIVLDKSALKAPAADSKNMDWPADRSLVRLSVGEPAVDLSAPRKVHQRRLDGYLPVVIGTWEDGGISYEQTCVAAFLDGQPARPRGDEAVVMLTRLTMTNSGSESQMATVRLSVEPAEKLVLEGDGVLAAGLVKDGKVEAYLRPRYRIGVSGLDRAALSIEGKSTLLYRDRLNAGQSRTLTWAAPYVDLGAEQRVRLTALLTGFDDVLKGETERWRKIVGQAASFDLPDPLLTDFYKASLVNLLITADPDPTRPMSVLPAGTFNYGVCLNESCIQVLSLEQRGLHADARRYLDSMLTGQSTRALQGRFTDSKGTFSGMPTAGGDYQTFNYNLDHGFTLWMLSEHYRYTRDREWLARVAPAMIEGCDFVTRQCGLPPGSNTLAAGDQNWGVGLLPPGQLEDPPEWLWWFAVNAYAWRGMEAAAESLAAINHPQAVRIAREADSFGDTLRRSCRESMIRSPVVRLRDGTYVPFQPTRSRLRGRDLGWIRDALYGPIHLIDCGVWPAGSQEAEWILRDAEDNVFIGVERGRDLSDFQRQWFSGGGATLQPNLLPVPPVYLARGLPKHALRGFYNTLCASVYADVNCFAEWMPEPGTAAGPLFKPPDESAFIVWLRDLLIAERGDDLDLLAGAPLEWLTGGRTISIRGAATWFGPLDLRVSSTAGEKELLIELDASRRNPPQWVRIHAGAPGRISSVMLDGRKVSSFDAKSGIIELPGQAAAGKLVISY